MSEARSDAFEHWVHQGGDEILGRDDWHTGQKMRAAFEAGWDLAKDGKTDVGKCAVCGRTAPLADGECPDCRH